jgi:ribosomal protein S12 methylthiotransferase accessory factor YcaO
MSGLGGRQLKRAHLQLDPIAPPPMGTIAAGVAHGSSSARDRIAGRRSPEWDAPSGVRKPCIWALLISLPVKKS